MDDAIKPERPGPRERLASSLNGLRRGVLHVRAMMSPRTYIASPWFRLGAAAVIGYRLGRPNPTMQEGHTVTVLRALLRTVFVNVATSAIRDTFSPEPNARVG